MKINILKIFIILISITFYSCENLTIDEPTFEVKVDSTTYKVGDEIHFHLNGTVENIVFWSGEQGHIYANRNRTNEKGVLQTVQFTSQVGAGSQNNNLSFKVSSDFNGTYDSINVAKATWQNITNRAILSSSTTALAGTSALSGAIDITDFNSPNGLLYFAFHYTSESNESIPRAWTISNFTVNNKLTDGIINTVIPNFSSAKFKLINLKDTMFSWVFRPDAINPSSMKVSADINAGATSNEDWAITAPINVNAVTAVDYGMSVSSLTTLSISNEFKYTYSKPGVYKITFYAFNQNINDVKSIVKEIIITVVP